MAKQTPPLWLPEGSVRSLMGLTVVGSAVASCFLNAPGRDFLMGLASGVIAFYFKSRETEGLPRADR